MPVRSNLSRNLHYLRRNYHSSGTEDLQLRNATRLELKHSIQNDVDLPRQLEPFSRKNVMVLEAYLQKPSQQAELCMQDD
jgi:hypothetical protein